MEEQQRMSTGSSLIGNGSSEFQVLDASFPRDIDNTNSTIRTTLLPFDKFAEWVHCICAVTFDLEVGQSMEVVCPSHIQLTEQDRTNVCFLAFPDSNSGYLGDTQFHFRTRLASPLSPSEKRKWNIYNSLCAPSLQVDRAIHYGYVFFRQIKDKNIKRGYFQKSVVILTKLPFLNIYQEVLRLIAPEFFENGVKALEFACKEVDRWPALIVGMPLSLPIFGHILNVNIPSLLDGALPGASYPSHLSSLPASLNIPITSVHDVDFLKIFTGFFSHLHIFWELILCNESFALIAPTPTICSEFIQALVWIIWPLKYASDYRPFFTIHDQDFRDYTCRTQAAPRIMLGVTNPFFVKTLQHWPHVLRIKDQVEEKESVRTKAPQKTANVVDFKQGLYSEYKSFLEKDKALVKRLNKGIQAKKPPEVLSAMIKKYFYDHTQSFMIPLERYVSTLMPLLRDISAFKSPPTLREFEAQEFLETVEVAGPQLTSGTKGDWEGLYKAFLKSSNFSHWLHMKKLEINRKLRLRHLEALAEADFGEWSIGKSEVELVDMILKTRSRLQAVRNDGTSVSQQLTYSLRSSVDVILGKLPADLRDSIKLNNQHI